MNVAVGSRRVGIMARAASLLAVGVLAALLAAGCGDDGDNGTGSKPDNPDNPGGGGKTDSAYTITFNPNGGTVSPTSAKTGDDGKLASLPTPTRSGFIFDGWYTAETGGTKVEAGRVYSANTTIYARWTEEAGEVACDESGSRGTFTDSRDGKNYGTTTICRQTWMAENLNYAAEGSKCYENNADSCARYGRLYNWATAMNKAASSSANPSGVQGVCPAGWHLPSDAEWGVLVDYAGGKDSAGGKLKAASGWNDNGNGTDDYGFSALPGGVGSWTDQFAGIGDGSGWWGSTSAGIEAYYRHMQYPDSKVLSGTADKGNMFSVRCVKD